MELNALLGALDFPVLSIDMGGSIVAANRAAAQLLGVRVDEVPGMDPERLAGMKAQIRFIRAFLYFRLANFYGDIPFFLQDISLEESRRVSRTPYPEVMSALHRELDEIVGDLPTRDELKADDNGRITKAAAMVLTDDNFASIEAAVEEGRGVWDNLVKFITWTLPTNFGEGLVIVTAILFGATLPITPLQILWINMTTAGALGLVLPLATGIAPVLTPVAAVGLALLQAGAAIVLDGLAASVPALLACRLQPSVQGYLVAGQASREVGHQQVLQALGLEPLLHLRLRCGEGVGACLAASMLLQGERMRALTARTC